MIVPNFQSWNKMLHTGFDLKHFNALSVEELYLILQLRIEVFVVEQNCVYQDLDNKDKKADHLFLMNDGKCMATCRLLAPGISYENYASIGRVAVGLEARKTGLGRKMMGLAITETKKLYPNHSIKISAQAYLQKFYESFGFVHTGESYLEDDIPHLGMVLI